MGASQVYAGERVTAAALNDLPADLALLTTGSVTNSSAQTSIGTFSSGYPANDAVVNGGYEFVVFGTWDSTSTPTIRIKLVVATLLGTRIYDTGTLTGSGTNTAEPWWIRAWMVITGTGSSGTFDSGGIGSVVNQGTTNPIASNFTAGSIDTTAAHDIIVNAQFGTPSSSNTCRTTGGLMSRM